MEKEHCKSDPNHRKWTMNEEAEDEKVENNWDVRKEILVKPLED